MTVKKPSQLERLEALARSIQPEPSAPVFNKMTPLTEILAYIDSHKNEIWASTLETQKELRKEYVEE